MSGQSVSGDIRLSLAVRGHRKIKRLRRLLGPGACWGLVCLWAFAGDQRWDGDLSGLSDADLEEEADWDGEPGALVGTLVELRLLSGCEGHRKIHDWAEHQPYAASRGQRVEASRKAAKARWERVKAEKNPPREDAEGMRPACDPYAGVMPQTRPDLTGTTKLPPHPSRASARETVGSFEPDPEDSRGTPSPPNPAAPHAVALNRAGFRCTAMNPALLAFAQDGGTVEHLLQVASLPECRGKGAGYVVAFARRELAERAAPAASGTGLVAGGSASPPRRTSRQAEGLMALERMKPSNRRPSS